MKNTILVVGMCCLCSVALVSSAAEQTGKIGYVNLNAVLEGTVEGKAIMERLQKEFGAKQKEFDDRMKAFEEKAKQFQQQQAMLKEDVRKERAQTLAKEEQDLRNSLMQAQNEINKKKADVLGSFEEQLRDVISAVAERNSVDYILRTEVLLHGPPKMDLTNEVIREYDRRHPAGSSPKKGK
jgi:Skp family chaperone for outer membrane proteins